MSLPIVIIPCGGKKLAGKHPAGRMYQGAYFKACLKAAMRTVNPQRIFILSGKYGLLRLDDVIETYEQRINEPGAIPVSQVRQQASRLGIIDAPRVLVFAGSHYAAVAKQIWPHAETPLVGMKGMGYQMKFLAMVARH